MPIEFRCTQCGTLLRTGEGTAGRQAQCPACGALSTVPGTAEGEPPPPEYSGIEEPYYPPPTAAVGAPSGQAVQLAALRVAAPATALIVTAVLGMAMCALSIVLNILLAMQPQQQQFNNDFPFQMNAGVNMATGVFGLAMAALVLFGAIKMKNLENYALAMAAAIIALIPCTSPCCILGLPFGIWALVVLCDGGVKAAFKH